MPPCSRTLENIRRMLKSLETKVHGEHFLSRQVCRYLHCFHIAVSGSEAKTSSQNQAKQILTQNGIPMSFKVTHFRVIARPIKHFMRLHNNIGFSSKGYKNMARNCSFGPPHVRLTFHFHRTPANIRMNLISPEIRVPGLNSCSS